MVHLEVKKVGRIPEGGGWRIHGRDSYQAKTVDRAKSAGAKHGYTIIEKAAPNPAGRHGALCSTLRNLARSNGFLLRGLLLAKR